MHAVISGQAGTALVIDGDDLSSLHVRNLDERIPCRAGEFHYLFRVSTDVVFREDMSLDDVRAELRSAADGEDVIQLTLLILAPGRSDDIRRSAGE